MKKSFDVFGMTCSACSSRVEKGVSKLKGVKEVQVNLLTNSMSVDFDENIISEKDIIDNVTSIGYSARIKGKENKDSTNKQDDESKKLKNRVIVSALFAIPLLYICMGHMFGYWIPPIFHGSKNSLIFAFTQFLLILPIVFVNFKYFTVGFKNLFKGSPNMDSLIAIGSSSAIIYGIIAIYNIGYGLGYGDMSRVSHYSMDLYFESAGTIITLITLGKYLESKAKGRTNEALSKLMDLSPKTATVIRNDVEQVINTEDIVVSDIIVVKSGESIAVDGVIIEGSGSIDESAITGESMPVEKNVDDKVIGATINKSGYFKMRATKVGSDTVLSQIINLVEQASSSKAPIARLADKISGIFVPIVIGIAVLASIVWLLLGYSAEFALSIGIAVLVISCPCALGLATPTAIMVGMGKGAENGVLMKSATSLEMLNKIDVIVFDKTGTITQGKPKVTDIIYTNSNIIEENKLNVIISSLENLSHHPLAQAIVEYGNSKNLTFEKVKDFKEISSNGISGIIDDELYFIGNERLMLQNGIDLTSFEKDVENLSCVGKTVLYVSNSKTLLALLGIADTVKENSKQAIQYFKNKNIKTIMLTGDNKNTAQAIAKKVLVNEVVSEVFPSDKEKIVKNLQEQGKIVAMVGDGINDAPALTRADIGIAIGAGTDIAIESADIVLMKSDLLDSVKAYELSHQTMKNIKQNLFWAFFYNIIGIPVAAGALYLSFGLKLNPMIAGGAMSLSSVFVVMNALRLKFFKSSVKNDNICNQKCDIIGNEVNTIKRKEEKKMVKVMAINGMMCMHCQQNVEKTLMGIENVVDAVVNLEEKTATVTMEQEVSDEILKTAVENAGYEVVGIAVE